MSVSEWQAILLMLFALCSLGGCSTDYNSDTYRPLGDPQAVHRGK